MSSALPAFDTHEVFNQPPPFGGRNLWADDVALAEAVQREGGDGLQRALAGYGGLAGDAAVLGWALTPTAIGRGCARMMRRAIASTRWSSIPRITS